MEYLSSYRNRPILSVKDYNTEKYNIRKKSRNKTLKVVGLALLIGLHYCAYKTRSVRIEEKVESRIERIIDGCK